jgi:hypothetical protein
MSDFPWEERIREIMRDEIAKIFKGTADSPAVEYLRGRGEGWTDGFREGYMRRLHQEERASSSAPHSDERYRQGYRDGLAWRS